MKPLIALALALLLLVGLTGVAAAQCATPYTVKPGDWLKTIGAQFGVTWQSIAAANNISNANLIYVGRVLCIPTDGATTTAAAPTTTTPAATTPANANTPIATGDTTPSGRPVPKISIVGVAPGQTVTIQTVNYPANLTFNVRMGALGTRGEHGVIVGTFNSGAGGAITESFAIPNSLAGAAQIAIRAESQTTAHFSFNWFYNR